MFCGRVVDAWEKWAVLGSNQRPKDYASSALTN